MEDQESMRTTFVGFLLLGLKRGFILTFTKRNRQLTSSVTYRSSVLVEARCTLVYSTCGEETGKDAAGYSVCLGLNWVRTCGRRLSVHSLTMQLSHDYTLVLYCILLSFLGITSARKVLFYVQVKS